MNKKTIAIIPARGGSNRLKNKNILELGGIPLIVHSINYAKSNSDIIDEIYITTDSLEIKKVALKNDVKVIDRPHELSGDFEPTVSALKHVLSKVKDVENVILLQPTNPLRPSDLLAKAFTIYQENQAESLFTVTQNHRKLGKIVDNSFKPVTYKIGQRSQDIEPLYFENGLLYITKASLIKEDVIFDDSSLPYIVNHPFSNVDIDTQLDFDYAEYMYNKYQSY